MIKRFGKRVVFVNGTFLAFLLVAIGILTLARIFILDSLQTLAAKLVYLLIVATVFLGSMVLGTLLSKSKTVISIGIIKNNESNNPP